MIALMSKMKAIVSLFVQDHGNVIISQYTFYKMYIQIYMTIYTLKYSHSQILRMINIKSRRKLLSLLFPPKYRVFNRLYNVGF